VKRLVARSISRSVWERWQERPFAGQILAAFERACYLGSPGGDVVAVVLPELDNGPLNIMLEDGPGLFATVEPGMSARLVANRLRVGGLEIDLASAEAWEPQSAWDKLRTCQRAIAERLSLVRTLALHHTPEGSLLALFAAPLAAPPTAAWPAAAPPAPPTLPANELAGWYRKPVQTGSRSLNRVLTSLTYLAANSFVTGLQAGWDGDRSQLQAGAVQLAGLGGGLTPAGDDFLVGVMLWAWLTHPAPQPLCQTVLEAAAPRTTTLSAAFLRAAARGECSASWHALLAALAEGTDTELAPAVEAVLAHGHTSGADTLAGFLWTVLWPASLITGG